MMGDWASIVSFWSGFVEAGEANDGTGGEVTSSALSVLPVTEGNQTTYLKVHSYIQTYCQAVNLFYIYC